MGGLKRAPLPQLEWLLIREERYQHRGEDVGIS